MIRVALSLAAVLALAGCGASKDPETSVVYISVTDTVTDEAPALPVDPATVTVVEKAPKAAAPKPKPKPKPKKPSKPSSLKFSGDGSAKIAPFTLSKDSTLYWSCDCQLTPGDKSSSWFAAVDPKATAANAIYITSTAERGKSFIAAGQHQLTIGATGAWTIEIVP